MFVKNENELKTQKQIIRIYSQDIGMELDNEKFKMKKKKMKQL